MAEFPKRATIKDAIDELKENASDIGDPGGEAGPLDGDGKLPNTQLHLGEIGGPAGPLDGSGEIPPSQLPPLQHDVGEATDEAGMLALDVSAPAMCVRADFDPPHVFFLTSDPASTLANWTDTGELAAGDADPTSQVGPAATNGVLHTYMRSDAAPAIDLTADYPWTGSHTFSGAVDLASNPITNVADPTNAQDAATKNYVDGEIAGTALLGGNSVDSAMQIGTTTDQILQFLNNDAVTLTLDGEELIWPSDVFNGKIRLYNSTPGSDNTFYGFGVANGALVFQVDSNTSVHRFQGVDGSDNANTILEISTDSGVVASVDLHMSEQKIINLGDPSSARDAVNLQYVEHNPPQDIATHTEAEPIGSDPERFHLCDASSNSVTLSIDATNVKAGKEMTFKKTDSSANGVTIETTVGMIDGSAQFTLSSQYEHKTIVCDGSNCWIIG